MKRMTGPLLDQLSIFIGVFVAVRLLSTGDYGAGVAVSLIVLLQASVVLSRAGRGGSRSDLDDIVQRQLDLDALVARNIAENARLRERLSALSTEPLQAPEQHTGWAASWCPVCGDCSCPRYASGERLEDDPRSEHCPLHGFRSSHAQWDELAERTSDAGAGERAPSEAATPPTPETASEPKERES